MFTRNPIGNTKEIFALGLIVFAILRKDITMSNKPLVHSAEGAKQCQYCRVSSQVLNDIIKSKHEF